MKLVGLFRKVLEENDGYYGFLDTAFDNESTLGYFLKFESDGLAICYTTDENNNPTYYLVYTEFIPYEYYTDYFEGYEDYDDDGSRYTAFDPSGHPELDESGIELYLKHKLKKDDYTENFQSFEEDGEFDIIKITSENEKLLFKTHKKFFLDASGHLD
jgi:hypothetical protein